MVSDHMIQAPPTFPSDSAHTSIISPDWDFNEMGIGGLHKVGGRGEGGREGGREGGGRGGEMGGTFLQHTLP